MKIFQVRKHQMQLFPLFEDYDRVHNGTVSRSQFRRVLTELELGGLVSQQDFELLWQQFDVKIGGKDDVNYIAFCDMIYKLANFEVRKP
jgi:Ca2+-binding EF-hand superfamily protein